MLLHAVTYKGPPIDDAEILAELPSSIRSILEQINGFIQFGGGLHLRGACRSPAWHSLREAWHGEDAFHRQYPTVSEHDIPFAQDALGDQFFLRNGRVFKLHSETGDIDNTDKEFPAFLQEAQENPIDFLLLNVLVEYHKNGGKLEPGQLLNVYPPFCTEESSQGVSLSAVSASERRSFLAGLARQLQQVEDGQSVEFIIDR